MKIIKPGDMLGFSGYDLSGIGINLGSGGLPFFGLSHIGIIARYNGILRLFESTTLCKLPCIIQGKSVSGAQVHDIKRRCEGYNGKVYNLRLKKELTPEQSKKLTNFLVKDVGKPYDLLGAGISGGWFLRKIKAILRPQDLNNLFCSEWCASALNEIDVFHTGNASTWNPNSLYRESKRRGICHKKKRII